MTKAIRWRIILLQVVAVLVFGFAAGGALYANRFINDQINQQLAPQQIYFPASAQQGLPSNLSQYAGQQVLTGDQAHAYAQDYIGLHLKEIGQGHPYSYWSGKAMKDTDAAQKAKDQAIADTLFKGATLQTMLNTAWTFWTMGQIAFYAFLGLLAAAIIVLGALVFEAVEMVRGRETIEPVEVTVDGKTLLVEAPVSKELAAAN